MGVAVNEAGRYDMAFGINDLVRRGVDPADGRDLSVLDPDISAIALPAGTVNYHAVLDDQIVTHVSFSPIAETGYCAPEPITVTLSRRVGKRGRFRPAPVVAGTAGLFSRRNQC